LYHDNAKKFETSSAGGTLTGDLVVTDDLILNSDSAAITWGADGDQKLFHLNDTGLILKSTATGDDTFPILSLHTGQTDIDDNDFLGLLAFGAPDEGTGTDAIIDGARIYARAEADFSSSVNKTKLVFQTAASGAPVDRLTLTGDGRGIAQFTGKLWIRVDMSNMSVPDSFNVSSIVDVNTGQARINMSSVMSNSSYNISTSAVAGYIAGHSNQNTGYFYLRVYDTDGSAADADYTMGLTFGDSAVGG